MNLNFQKKISLQSYNTFGINVLSNQFVGVKSTKEIQYVLSQKKNEKILILGGGSNILLTKDFDGLTMRIESKGIKVINENDEFATLKVAAGENWHDFVLWCLKNDLGGVENLALIPGSIGAAPIQNIGAYGAELKSVFSSCEAVSVNSGVKKTFDKAQCQFGYRNSIFKNKGEDYFRKLETQQTLKELKKDKSVISLGGGAFLNSTIRQCSKKHSISFWLDVPIETLLKRLKKSKNRPLLGKDKTDGSIKKIGLSKNVNITVPIIKVVILK